MTNRIEAESIIAAMGSAMGVLGVDYEVLYQNPASIELVGNHIGERCYSAFEGKTAVCEGCPVAASFRDGKVHSSVRRIKIGGRVSYFENTASVLKNADGKVVGAVEVCRDITQHKINESRLLHAFDSLQRPAEDLISAIRRVYRKGTRERSAPSGADAMRDKKTPPRLNLSRREYQVLCMIGSGKRTKEIAEELSVSPKTVNVYRHRILLKMHLNSNAELMLFFIENRLADLTYDDIRTRADRQM